MMQPASQRRAGLQLPNAAAASATEQVSQRWHASLMPCGIRSIVSRKSMRESLVSTENTGRADSGTVPSAASRSRRRTQRSCHPSSPNATGATLRAVAHTRSQPKPTPAMPCVVNLTLEESAFWLQPPALEHVQEPAEVDANETRPLLQHPPPVRCSQHHFPMADFLSTQAAEQHMSAALMFSQTRCPDNVRELR